MNNRTGILSVKSAETIESRLTEEELATYERLRAEWRADRAAKAEAKEEEEAEAWQRAIDHTAAADADRLHRHVMARGRRGARGAADQRVRGAGPPFQHHVQWQMTELEQHTLDHEAAHAAGALAQGLRVSEVSRVPSDPSELGHVTLPGLWEDIDCDRARKAMKMIMLGPALSGQGVPEWPLSHNRTKDERMLSVLADGLGLDERGYNHLVVEMWKLSTTRKFCRILTVVTAWLERVPRMDAAMVAQAQTIAWL